MSIEQYQTREEWLEGRKKGIGSSEAPIILGVSRWDSPLGLFAEKTGRREPKDMTGRMKWGLRMQPFLLSDYAEETGRKVVPIDLAIYRMESHPILSASPDAMILDTNKGEGILEVKSTRMGRAWTVGGEPPIEAQVQIQHQMMVTGLGWAAAAVIIDWTDFYHTPDIAPDKALFEIMREMELEFHRRVVLDDPPKEMDAHQATKEALKLLWPNDSGETISLKADAFEWYHQLLDAKKRIKEDEIKKREAENYLKRMLESATHGVLPNGKKITCRNIKRVDKAREAKEISFRQLRTGKGDDDD